MSILDPNDPDYTGIRDRVAVGAARLEPDPEGVCTDFASSVQGAVYRDLMERLGSSVPHSSKQAAEGIQERAEWGKGKYGTYLLPFNGRFGAVDAMQEAADLVVYLKQMVLEGDKFAEGLYPAALATYVSMYAYSKKVTDG